ncbi:LexA family transcriptional regulator [Caulobacter segnis]|nr:S24 family peptidase [Caulobacter segnis]
MGPSEIVEELKRLQVPHDAIAKVIGRDRTAATKMLSGKRSVKFNEVAGLEALIAEYRGGAPEVRPAPSPPVSVVPPIKNIARRIPVVGDVQAGVWLEAVVRETYEVEEYLPIDVAGYESATLRAMRVVGPSMNKLYPPGRFVVLADPAEAGIRNGDHVVVERRKDSLTEITLKEYVEEADGRVALWPRSDHPDYQEPFYLRTRDEADQDGVKIIGVVVADYRRRDRPPA